MIKRFHSPSSSSLKATFALLRSTLRGSLEVFTLKQTMASSDLLATTTGICLWILRCVSFLCTIVTDKTRLGLIVCVFDRLSSLMNFLHTSTMHTLPFRRPDLHSRHCCVPRLQSCSKCVFWKSSRWPVSPHRLQVYVVRLP